MKKKKCIWILTHIYKLENWWKEWWDTSCGCSVQQEWHQYKIVKTYAFCPFCGKPLEVK